MCQIYIALLHLHSMQHWQEIKDAKDYENISTKLDFWSSLLDTTCLMGNSYKSSWSVSPVDLWCISLVLMTPEQIHGAQYEDFQKPLWIPGFVAAQTTLLFFCLCF